MGNNFEKMYASLGKWGKSLGHSTFSVERMARKNQDKVFDIRFSKVVGGVFIRAQLNYRDSDLNGGYVVIVTNRETNVDKASRGINENIGELLRKGGLENIIDTLTRESLGVSRLDYKSLEVDNLRHDLTDAMQVLDRNTSENRFLCLSTYASDTPTPKLRVWEANETGNIKRTLECSFVSANTLGNIKATNASVSIPFNISEPDAQKRVFKALFGN